MKLVVDTGVFSAALSRRRRPPFERHVNTLASHQLFLSVVTVAELRFGAMVAERGQPRRAQLEVAIATATVVPVTDAFITRLATTRAADWNLTTAGPPVTRQVQRRLDHSSAAALHEARRAGATIDELAARFGIHRTTVIAHLHRSAAT